MTLESGKVTHVLSKFGSHTGLPSWETSNSAFTLFSSEQCKLLKWPCDLVNEAKVTHILS